MAVMRICSSRCSATTEPSIASPPVQQPVQQIARDDAGQQDAHVRRDQKGHRNFDGAGEEIPCFCRAALRGPDMRRFVDVRRHDDHSLMTSVVAPSGTVELEASDS